MRRMAPVILIPADLLGRQPTGYCGLCDVPFYGDRDVRGHLQSARHKDAVEQARAAEQERREDQAWLYEVPDPEVEEYLQKVVGPRMRAEGRWTVKKSERAGF